MKIKLAHPLIITICLLGFCSQTLAKLTLTNHVLGISGELETNAKSRLEAQQQEDKLLTVEVIKQLNIMAPKEIALSLQPYGYFHVDVTSSQLTKSGNDWHAFYYVRQGAPVIIEQVNTSIIGDGKDNPKIINFLHDFPIKVGSIFNTVKYKQAKQSFLDLAASEGYILARIERSEIKVDTKNNVASIFFCANSGPLHLFGPITFAKNPLGNKLLAKLMTYKEHDFFSTTKVHDSQNNLNNSNLFESVTIEPKYDETQNLKVPTIIHINPRKSQQYTFGLGYGTDTGVRGLFGFELYNFAANGQHLNGMIKASNNGLKDTKGDLEAHYIIPGKNPITDQYDLGVGSNVKDLDYGKSTLVKGGFGYTTSVFSWQQIARLDLLHEWWRFTDQDAYQSTMLLPSIMWIKKKVNDPINPTSGYRINLLVQGTTEFLAANFDFLQANLDGKLMYQIPKGPILSLRGNVGYTLIADKNLAKLPLSFWFATGGSSTLRGYSYEEIGPGKELAVFNVEFQQKLFVDHLYGILFYDFGNAANNIFTRYSEYPFYKHQSIGFGFSYLSPVGSIRLSYARAIDQPGAPGKIQFSIGPDL